MGDQRSTTETQNTAGPQDPRIARLLSLLSETGAGAAGQFGDLSQIANGNFAISPQDRTLVQDAQRATGEVAGSQMQAGLQDALRMVEDQSLQRGIEGSSIEAVNNAVIGRDFQRQMAELLNQQRGEASMALMNMPFQRAGAQIGANQALFQRLIGTAQPAVTYDAAIRQMTGSQSSETVQPFNIGNTLFQAGTQLGSARLGRPA